MCGISAIQSLSGATLAEDKSQLESQLRASIKAIGHRGPDSSGVYISEDGSLGLAHARLSIIDLKSGQQPLHDVINTIHAVVNGEFYDYADIRKDLEAKGCQFLSSVDSELIIHLYQTYGQNFIHRLRGEFAFVLYDSKRRLLMAARDRFGIKPLYYTVVNGKLMFASEMKGLVPFGWKPEWDAESIMQYGEFFDNRTVFKGVYKMPPGHLLTCNRSGQIENRIYWEHEYPHAALEDPRSVQEMIEGVRQRLVDAVRVRLRSDVPLGVYLSGGIDSAAVAGIASALLKEKDPNAKLMTFTLAFPAREDVDEGPIARRMAESIGAEIHMVAPTEEDLVREFPRSIYHTEQPTMSFHGTGKMILSKFVHDNGYRVVLTGEGSDEIFGGYFFLMPDFLRAADPAVRRLGIPLPTDEERSLILQELESSGLRQDHFSLRKFSFQDGQLGRELVGGISTYTMFAAGCLSDAAFVPRHLYNSNLTVTAAEGLSPDARRKMCSGQWHPLHGSLYISTKIILRNVLLNALGDRVEMANSIEGRTPFLDHYLVEYVNTLPPSVKIMPLVEKVICNGSIRNWKFTEKWVLRQAVKPFVTEEIYKNTKAQYNTPIARPAPEEKALTPLQIMVKSRVTKEAIEKLGWASWDYFEEVLRDYLSSSPECPSDGGLDKRARILLIITSFLILQEKFHVPTWVCDS
ncbi:asparagine synthase [Moniliophthora roreri MCA 2997]|uniref:Asparagine synthase n=2 Tax=Moniliophthora roreri TaxID=221103 RepID=V2XQX0_MONRO|nr:asparagine synthase [Moniliophthora roreri MCA 2997]KAI3616339.1 asparagine synthase [Moniliophthora roreri]